MKGSAEKPWFQGYLGSVNGDKGPAVGPTKTTVPEIPWQGMIRELTVIRTQMWVL